MFLDDSDDANGYCLPLSTELGGYKVGQLALGQFVGFDLCCRAAAADVRRGAPYPSYAEWREVLIEAAIRKGGGR